MVDATTRPLSGLWKPNHLEKLWYGPKSVDKHLIESLPKESSRVFIITGSSLATKTPLVKQVEALLGQKHAGTFANIKQHAPIAQLNEATDMILKDSDVDTLVSIGGGSPIDTAKAISYNVHERVGKYLYHITIPTTLSAAECTFSAGFTQEDGVKTSVGHPELVPHAIIYDSKFALETPPKLWLSTGFRALDHAMELMFHPTATEVPARQMCLSAASNLFINLPKYKTDPKNENVITQLQLSAFGSLGFLGTNVKGGLGLSHALGYALGSPYSIPHGITSCLTLGHVIKLKAQEPDAAAQIARMAPFVGLARTGNDQLDATAVGDAILELVEIVGLKTSLREYNVGEDQLPIIVQRATRQDQGPLYDKVAELVKGLY
ncbi:uncharacterized protein J3D65DRAFT_644027 [Phyllosticta citribraziliensis]|uniref:Alcohol dehydrogenase iron-type/glycerol dehydrogenase GldA domain-containing protein n=1 Tax=Phyllosticta citribraziliensis TaxID=989973 RepID=A0ABR1M6C6_9PEZI